LHFGPQLSALNPLEHLKLLSLGRLVAANLAFWLSGLLTTYHATAATYRWVLLVSASPVLLLCFSHADAVR
jgi:hypothetical protein